MPALSVHLDPPGFRAQTAHQLAMLLPVASTVAKDKATGKLATNERSVKISVNTIARQISEAPADVSFRLMAGPTVYLHSEAPQAAAEQPA